jgi:hypothetical protein
LRIAPDAETDSRRHNLALSLHSLERYEEASRIFTVKLLEQPADGHYADLYLHAINNEIERPITRRRHCGRAGDGSVSRKTPGLWTNSPGPCVATVKVSVRATLIQRAEALAYPDLEPRHKTVLSLPFRGRWRVTQGNVVPPHIAGLSARFAWDFSAVNEQGENTGWDSRSNHDFLSFGQDCTGAG